MIQLGFKGGVKGLEEYLKFAEWCLKDSQIKWPGSRVEKVFSDFSGYTAV